MKWTLVRYQAKPERADENQKLVEKVFARPGMGRLIYDAILGNDYNLALAALLLATLLTLLGNLLADIGLVLLDRRLRLGEVRS